MVLLSLFRRSPSSSNNRRRFSCLGLPLGFSPTVVAVKQECVPPKIYLPSTTSHPCGFHLSHKTRHVHLAVFPPHPGTSTPAPIHVYPATTASADRPSVEIGSSNSSRSAGGIANGGKANQKKPSGGARRGRSPAATSTNTVDSRARGRPVPVSNTAVADGKSSSTIFGSASSVRSSASVHVIGDTVPRGGSSGAGHATVVAATGSSGGGSVRREKRCLAVVAGTTNTTAAAAAAGSVKDSSSDLTVRRGKRCPVDVGGGGGGGAGTNMKKVIPAKEEPRSPAATTAITGTATGTAGPSSSSSSPRSSLKTEDDDVQRMVDRIKSRNQNNGGGRQAKGGRWTRENCNMIPIPLGYDRYFCCTTCRKASYVIKNGGPHGIAS